MVRLGTKAENRKDGEEQMICPRCGTNKFVVNRKTPSATATG
nr:MAG TPA: Transcription factor S-II (TFIIS) [Caudoviricetes sp.]